MKMKGKIQGLNEVKDLEMSKAHLLTADAVRKDYVFLLTSNVRSCIINDEGVI